MDVYVVITQPKYDSDVYVSVYENEGDAYDSIVEDVEATHEPGTEPEQIGGRAWCLSDTYYYIEKRKVL